MITSLTLLMSFKLMYYEQQNINIRKESMTWACSQILCVVTFWKVICLRLSSQAQFYFIHFYFILFFFWISGNNNQNNKSNHFMSLLLSYYYLLLRSITTDAEGGSMLFFSKLHRTDL